MQEPSVGLWGRLSLVQKSIILGSILLIVNSVVLSLTFFNIQERYQLRALEDEGVAAAQSIAEVSKYGMITRSREILDDQITGMITRNISGIELLDIEGNSVSEAAGSKRLVFDSAALKKKALTSSSHTKDMFLNDDGQIMAIVITHPIEQQKKGMREEIGLLTEQAGAKERIGTVIVVMNGEQVYKDLDANKRTFFFLVVIIIAVGIIVIIVYVEITAYPLKKLVLATQKVSEGNLGYKAEVTSQDEIGHLARSFNIMVEKLKETQEKLVMTERLAASGRLAADVAHEINNPLAIMKNYIYVMMKKKLKPDDPGQQTLAIIDGEIDRVARIITQFNDFYKGSNLPLEEIDIHEPLREVVIFCKEGFEEKRIALEERLDATGKVMGNRDKLKQVFINLLKNANEAMPDGGRIVIETARADGKITVSVADTGTGIDQDVINRIFDPFFSTKGIKGVGLGLAVSYGIIKSLNGDINVESEAGKGTTFKVTLPAI